MRMRSLYIYMHIYRVAHSIVRVIYEYIALFELRNGNKRNLIR